ncbi:bifunctional 2-C-methyl-D-erythritol 4-phosphate cytidylyltransferase/2-C-methyl-D-erythritol 2,4-cyclodiphosphate synthase [Frigidibacter sp. ROC022]|uniref:bifunctional 2-C-methyl-D-erythritol 4-phosphate cytidylyltransferase/2-C-methyl-D-erythritol 2,4-cyclodiphosphate synthase n=1 Tax=Frigidibacter sp. ROC022 TaxID=2971796 RepID=UPI00215A230B|nr:bifunctional 2-C-methyl-D-erythritol 4-phosphate cytidylyltransferase/2-C-methyl-D-erythritol 2,4-cyclodiphosphate synthase [Frigidibacter sp. ROC022]MCR8723444.1 bifunctional 2-C-methyl-D-erythritol 4-phosphate cytidylyltransferase/2-C-methyl-D-erythritol 2,4-cyclodiphosphate synthase [Frigidibacter sp. ROC022]
MSTAIIIVAAGSGIRMGGPVAKQWQVLGSKGVVHRSVEAFQAALPEARIVLVLRAEDLSRADEFPGCQVVAGGAERAGSVLAGLEALEGSDCAHVLIHDAARPLVPAEMILRVSDTLDRHVAVAPGLALSDALWRTQGDRITGTADRTGLWRAQTPQGFRYEAILEAHRAHRGGPAADDVAVALAAGIEVALVNGDERALKLTHPEDMERASAMLEVAMDVRVGQGFDVHAFGPGDHVTLCGVTVPHGRGLAGHSDADVGLHALCDAIYGALGAGDIGRHFPPSEAEWKGADSMRFLDHAAGLVRERGYRVSQADVTLICEAPKIGPHAQAMQDRIAPVLGVAADRISVKATTSERLGFTGREEGIAAMAVATLVAP